jgi:hypothetical protein
VIGSTGRVSGVTGSSGTMTIGVTIVSAIVSTTGARCEVRMLRSSALCKPLVDIAVLSIGQSRKKCPN